MVPPVTVARAKAHYCDAVMNKSKSELLTSTINDVVRPEAPDHIHRAAVNLKVQ